MKSFGLFILFISLFLNACAKNESPLLTTSVPGIIGGTVASSTEFPFAVNIWFNDPKENYIAHHCGGSLIAARWVLTAAHCVFEEVTETTSRVVPTAKLKLYLGGLQHSGNDGKALKLKAIHVHPEFKWPAYDFALLELAESVSDVQPLTLSSEDLSNSTDLVTSIGWGLMNQEGTIESDVLLKVTVPLKPRALCQEDRFVQLRGYQLGEETLCTQTSFHQKSSCQGDSGGPLLKVTNGKLQQVGVVSWGSACSGKRVKVASDIGGYAAIKAALPWLQTTIK